MEREQTPRTENGDPQVPAAYLDEQERPRVWTAPEIAAAAGIEYRTLHNWIERGLLTPSLREASGSGHSALFSDSDLITACLLGAARPLLSLDGLAYIAGGRP